jgi:hypothetical protein
MFIQLERRRKRKALKKDFLIKLFDVSLSSVGMINVSLKGEIKTFFFF